MKKLRSYFKKRNMRIPLTILKAKVNKRKQQSQKNKKIAKSICGKNITYQKKQQEVDKIKGQNGKVNQVKAISKVNKFKKVDDMKIKKKVIKKKEALSQIFEENLADDQQSYSTNISQLQSHNSIQESQLNVHQTQIQDKENIKPNKYYYIDDLGYKYNYSQENLQLTQQLQPNPLNTLIQQFQQKQAHQKNCKQQNLDLFIQKFQQHLKQNNATPKMSDSHHQQLGNNHHLSDNIRQPLQEIQPTFSNQQSYDQFQFEPSSLECFYPKQIKSKLDSCQNDTDKIFQDLQCPEECFDKYLQRMQSLTTCQLNFMQAVFQNIQNQYQPLKAQLNQNEEIEITRDQIEIQEEVNNKCSQFDRENLKFIINLNNSPKKQNKKHYFQTDIKKQPDACLIDQPFHIDYNIEIQQNQYCQTNPANIKTIEKDYFDYNQDQKPSFQRLLEFMDIPQSDDIYSSIKEQEIDFQINYQDNSFIQNLQQNNQQSQEFMEFDQNNFDLDQVTLQNQNEDSTYLLTSIQNQQFYDMSI